MNKPDDSWKKLVNATRPLQDETEIVAPVLKVSVKSLRDRVQALVLTLTWKKLSLLAAFFTGIFFLIFFFLLKEDTLQKPIIQPEFPSTPSAP